MLHINMHVCRVNVCQRQRPSLNLLAEVKQCFGTLDVEITHCMHEFLFEFLEWHVVCNVVLKPDSAGLISSRLSVLVFLNRRHGT